MLSGNLILIIEQLRIRASVYPAFSARVALIPRDIGV
ncbi:hypothetical protein GGD66_002340 [Bradyrhizobium sp. CIR48]|nr:hypothetical protein [Bradyrhizobium sp. CIR48]